MSILNDIMNPVNLLELDEEQFKVQPIQPVVMGTPFEVITADQARKITQQAIRNSVLESIDCDGLDCSDCTATDCPLYHLKGCPIILKHV